MLLDESTLNSSLYSSIERSQKRIKSIFTSRFCQNWDLLIKRQLYQKSLFFLFDLLLEKLFAFSLDSLHIFWVIVARHAHIESIIRLSLMNASRCCTAPSELMVAWAAESFGVMLPKSVLAIFDLLGNSSSPVLVVGRIAKFLVIFHFNN